VILESKQTVIVVFGMCSLHVPKTFCPFSYLQTKGNNARRLKASNFTETAKSDFGDLD
jgi:hypothetical protein